MLRIVWIESISNVNRLFIAIHRKSILPCTSCRALAEAAVATETTVVAGRLAPSRGAASAEARAVVVAVDSETDAHTTVAARPMVVDMEAAAVAVDDPRTAVPRPMAVVMAVVLRPEELHHPPGTRGSTKLDCVCVQP